MYVCVCVCVCVYVRQLFLSVRSTQFPFKLNILFKKKYINLLGPKILRCINRDSVSKIDESVIKALSGNPDAMDIIAKIERHLNEVTKNVDCNSYVGI
jgi:hypothetical protein